MAHWEKNNLYATPTLVPADQKEYVLDMYPYPSGSGLHVGHVEGYTATDIYCRYLRMKGKKVLHPIGFDSFGLPAENYAVKTGTHPKITTEEAIATFTGQMKALGLSYDWDLVLAAHRPDYYQWTQWLFLLMYKRGLAYRKKQAVNWCSGCQTVLANEQVVDGKCERCETVAVQKDMEQWFLKITDYAERLLHDLDGLDWPESTKTGQRNWIGKSEGVRMTAKIKGTGVEVETFSAHFEAFCADTFVVIAPNHPRLSELLEGCSNKDEILVKAAELLDKQMKGKNAEDPDHEGVFTGLYIEDPVGNGDLPLWISTYALVDYGTGIVKCSAHDKRDFVFAKKYGIRLKPVLFPKDAVLAAKVKNLEVYYDDFENGYLTEPTGFDAKPAKQYRQEIIAYLESHELAKRGVSYRLRDWLISRQRFWGAPIPMKKYKVQSTKEKDETWEYKPVEEGELPVVLPMDAEFKPTGKSPLTEHPDFQDREVDTMDTFVDSSWYFFRFAQLTSAELRTKVANGKEHNPFDDKKIKERLNRWCPVDLYVGGAEHTVLHLLYARFFTKVLYDAGYIAFQEPFLKLRHQGTILGPDHRKMSKRWGNVINPLDVIAQYGADTLRMYEMFMGPLDQTKPWSVSNVAGIHRFLSRVWNISLSRIGSTNQDSDTQKEVLIALHKMIKKVGDDIPELKFNTAIAECMIFMNAWESAGADGLSRGDFEKFMLVLAPYAPYMTEELWSLLGHTDSIHTAKWPEYDPSLLVADSIEIPVQVNGKVRGTVSIARQGVENEELVRKTAESNPAVAKHLAGSIAKVIYVPGKILNIISK